MADEATTQREFSARRIVGFACNQAFLICALFLGGLVGVARSLPAGDVTGRLDLLLVLLFMVVGFAVVRLAGAGRASALFARPLLYLYAVLAAGGSLLPLLFPDAGIAPVLAKGLLTGSSSALLLTAWGRAFDREDTKTSVPEVFLGSLVGALVCLAFSLAAETPIALGAVCLLPLASVVNIEVASPLKAAGFGKGGTPEDLRELAGENNGPGLTDESGKTPAQQLRRQNDGNDGNDGNDALRPGAGTSDDGVTALSARVLAGTLLFGMASGVMLLEFGVAGGEWLAHFRMGLVLFAAFLIGALTLLLSDGFGRGAALNKSYRLAVFVMMMGVLIVPWPFMGASILPGETVVLAGSLGLQAVLISLFLVLAELTGADCALSFSAGFTALFGGELAGALTAGGIASACPPASQLFAAAVLAGGIVLVAYIFLFTERDFDELSQLVTEGDALEEARERITAQYGLSNRESEILAYALRGRTNERIAQELVISKSTVDTHLRRIYAKCGVHSRQELLDLAESR